MLMASAHASSSNGKDRNQDSDAKPERVYITTRQAADILGVNRATVINWARQGRFNAIQYGARGIYRFDRAEIVEFLDKSRLQNASGGPQG